MCCGQERRAAAAAVETLHSCPGLEWFARRDLLPMKTLLLAVGLALLATTLCICLCRLCGMAPKDLEIAALVSGSVSLITALGAFLLARAKQSPP